MSGAHRVVLAADRTLMSEYAGNIFFGFFAGAPRDLLPTQDWLYFHFLCPSVPVDKETGEPLRAPFGLRKVEAKLLGYGFHRDDVAAATNSSNLTIFLFDNRRKICLGMKHH